MRIGFDRNLASLRLRLPVLYATELALGAAPDSLMSKRIARLLREEGGMHLVQNALLLVERADLDVIEGMLFLEYGLTPRARECFGRSEPLYRQAEETALALPGQFLARRYLNRLSGKAP